MTDTALPGAAERREAYLRGRELRALADRAAEDLADAPAEVILQWAIDMFDPEFAVTSSMSELVVVHLASKLRPGVPVVFLDTGYHFRETLLTRDRAAKIYDISLINAESLWTVPEQDADQGPDLWAREPDRCCWLRKVEPLGRSLAPFDAYATGARREETSARSDLRVVEWDARREKVRVNPLARWSEADVESFVVENGVVTNPLLFDGYPSIGCAPCTRRVADGEDKRAGRWSGFGKTECGVIR